MALEQEITAARKEIVADGYDMSIGELVNLYRDNELQINPAYQRLFRWPATTKTRFIESILLGLPLPPIFVFQQTSGVWELIDGLQRISTVLEFVGILKDPEGVVMPPLRLSGTQLLPSLAEKVWEPIEKEVSEFLCARRLVNRFRLICHLSSGSCQTAGGAPVEPCISWVNLLACWRRRPAA